MLKSPEEKRLDDIKKVAYNSLYKWRDIEMRTDIPEKRLFCMAKMDAYKEILDAIDQDKLDNLLIGEHKEEEYVGDWFLDAVIIG